VWTEFDEEMYGCWMGMNGWLLDDHDKEVMTGRIHFPVLR
jgi:hypothetical protein